MDYDKEITAVAAKVTALQVLIVQICIAASRQDRALGLALRSAFDEAANFMEDQAIRLGKAASPEHTVKAVRVIEELRTATFGDEKKPKSGV